MRKEQMIGARVPNEFVRDLEAIERVEQSDRSTTVRKLLYRAIAEWKRDYWAQQYGGRKVSMERAAQEAGVSLWEMMDYLRSRKIAAQYSFEDLEHDLVTVEKRVARDQGKKGAGRRAGVRAAG